MVKRHKAQKAAALIDEEKREEEVERDIGRDLELGNQQQRVAWEALYGDKGYGKVLQADSGVGTSATTPRKSSVSVAEKAEAFEATDTKSVARSSTKAQQPPRVTVRVASEDSIYELPSATVENLLLQQSDEQPDVIDGPKKEPSEEAGNADLRTLIAKPTDEEVGTQRDAHTGPSVVPLPFTVNDEDQRNLDDKSSIATFAVSDRLTDRLARKLSITSFTRNFSRNPKRQTSASLATESRLMIPQDDDQATSVAATVDNGDKSSVREESDREPRMSSSDQIDHTSTSEPLVENGSLPLTYHNLNGARSQSSEQPVNRRSFDHVSNGQRVTHSDEVINPVTFVSQPGRLLIDEREEPHENHSAKSVPLSKDSQEPAVLASLRNQLPEGGSKIVTTYRTNEWAKHLEQAEAPLLEALSKPSRASNASLTTTETVAPVHVKDLQLTALTAEPAPIKTSTSIKNQWPQRPSTLARSPSSSRDALPSQRQYYPMIPPKSSLRRSSQGKPMNRTSSQGSLHHPQAVRRSSAPLKSSPLAGSPIEEGVEMSFPQRGNRLLSGMFTNTLMAQRNSKLQNRYSSNSLARTNSSTSLLPVSPLDDQHENPTLAYRKSLLQRQSYQPRRPNLATRTSASYSPYHISSNEPPLPIERKESINSAWRTSLRNDSSADALDQQQLEAKRTELLSQKRMASAGAQAVRAERSKRESQRDGEMKRGDMMERHREAMKKMQAEVEM